MNLLIETEKEEKKERGSGIDTVPYKYTLRKIGRDSSNFVQTKLSLKHSNFVWRLKNIDQSIMSWLLVQCYFQHIAYGS